MKINDNTLEYIENLVQYIIKMVFKDELIADSQETEASMKASSEYMAAFLKMDDHTEAERKQIINDYQELNPYYKNLFDTYQIPYYTSRRAKDFDIIYFDSDMETTYPYLSQYAPIYKKCLTYFYATNYAKSMETEDNYRNFCLMSINIMALINYIDNWLKYPYDIDMMNESMIDDFILSFGISYFKSVPLQYKQKIAKNINSLIRNKGTDKVIINILDIFNFDNINIFKYYLVRDETRKETNGTNTIINNPRFISHNIRIDSLSKAIKADAYNDNTIADVTLGDDTWRTTDTEIARYNFDYVQSKYFSIESGFELAKEGLNTVYLLNLLRKIRESYSSKEFLTFTASKISLEPITLEDTLVLLQILTLDYQGVVDNIEYDLENIVSIYQFKEKSGTITYPTEIVNTKPVDPNSYLVKDMTKETSFDKEKTLEIFDYNIGMQTNIKNALHTETNYKRYKQLKQIYYARFTQKLNYAIFNKAETYTDYILSRNIDIYNFLMGIRNIESPEERQIEIEREITYVTDVVKSYLNDMDLFFGSTSVDILSSYLRDVIEVFKSFTVTLRELSFFMVLKEELDGRVFDDSSIDSVIPVKDHITGATWDNAIFLGNFHYYDKVHLHDIASIFTYLGTEITTDTIYFKDKPVFDADFKYEDIIHIQDKFRQISVFRVDEHIQKYSKFNDFIYTDKWFNLFDNVNVHDNLINNGLFIAKDSIKFNMYDSIASAISYFNEFDTIFVRDYPVINTIYYNNSFSTEVLEIDDKFIPTSTYHIYNTTSKLSDFQTYSSLLKSINSVAMTDELKKKLSNYSINEYNVLEETIKSAKSNFYIDTLPDFGVEEIVPTVSLAPNSRMLMKDSFVITVTGGD
jgi:hypothetical protein